VIVGRATISTGRLSFLRAYEAADLRAAAMAGDLATSRQAYQDFFAWWKNADPDLPVLVAAKAEYGKLK